MDPMRVRALLEEVGQGRLEIDAALEALRALPFADLGYARVDHHRALRQGVPEAVLAEGKSLEQIVGIAEEIIRVGQNAVITRLGADRAQALLSAVPSLRYVPVARLASFEPRPAAPLSDVAVPVVTAGTSDIPVAEEAIETLRLTGIEAARMFDVGVAGIHRIVEHLAVINAAPAVIVVAGMEGALASVVGGLTSVPIVAVPTSIGYGVSLGGLTALFSMLSSCASGVTVVNIDNGFGAAMAVVRMMSARSRERREP